MVRAGQPGGRACSRAAAASEISGPRPALGEAEPQGAAARDQVQALQQENLGLRRRAEEREEELAAAREANRRLMTGLNKTRS